ncbi:MAG: disulfide reductase [Candidatus Latescibacteria bacterium]|nr:disulfide reductase [Candidatus Latescibacterota bacterium]NIO27217.1 disulfide reductase [Candidatus Latescibacterota bacterium]NIO54741.1 disulfide reductase [Candidatus Latescibacterota bacterium]NIT00824.1 disulfide reductase [Candidatus Latescibacterota bacterium]NIT37747.1 disulfide reductase [Candidatus Latescibacterota bacterium]
MKYLYYPGCSLESTGKPYDVSVRTVFKLLGFELEEIADWNCCGATAYMSVKETVALSISARVLALAEKIGGEIIAPCSSCYTILSKTNRDLKANPELEELVKEALDAGGLTYNGTVSVRHPLDVLVNDIGIELITAKAVRSLHGLKTANYYGCQLVRPEKGFDDREFPTSMDNLFASLGAENVYFPAKVRCCGGMLMTTFTEVGLKLNHDILQRAKENAADVILTTCPMCHINLEGYQSEINKKFHTNFNMPIVYFTQLLGWALGAGMEEVGMELNLIPIEHRVVGGVVTR